MSRIDDINRGCINPLVAASSDPHQPSKALFESIDARRQLDTLQLRALAVQSTPAFPTGRAPARHWIPSYKYSDIVEAIAERHRIERIFNDWAWSWATLRLWMAK